MVMGITEVGRVGEHDGGEPLFPEGSVVAASGIRQFLSVTRHDQGNEREVRFHGIDDGASQILRPFIADYGQKISCCWNRDRHTRRSLLRV